MVSPDFCSDAPSHTSAANHRRSTKHPTVVASAARRCLNPWWMGKKVQGSSKGKSHCCISSRLFNTIQSTWIKTWVSALFRIEFVKICSNYLKFPKWFFLMFTTLAQPQGPWITSNSSTRFQSSFRQLLWGDLLRCDDLLAEKSGLHQDFWGISLK